MPTIEESLEQTLKFLTEQKGAPVPGAILKTTLIEKGVALPSGKFKDFLASYSNLVTVISRKGQDILVIPKGSENLLQNKEGARPSKIRYDFYKAFTTINPTQSAFYSKDTDFIEWKDQGTDVAQTLIPIPPRTQATEVEVRKNFVQSLGHEHKEVLSKALEMEWAISAFGREIRRLSLLDQWFKFRVSDVVTRITEWASAVGIEVRASWISSDEKVNVVSHHQTNELIVRPLLDGLKKLDSADLARITIPLDVVLKMLGK